MAGKKNVLIKNSVESDHSRPQLACKLIFKRGSNQTDSRKTNNRSNQTKKQNQSGSQPRPAFQRQSTHKSYQFQRIAFSPKQSYNNSSLGQLFDVKKQQFDLKTKFFTIV